MAIYEKVFVRPKRPGFLVPEGAHGEHIPDDGKFVIFDTFLQRREREGSIIVDRTRKEGEPAKSPVVYPFKAKAAPVADEPKLSPVSVAPPKVADPTPPPAPEPTPAPASSPPPPRGRRRR